MVPIVERLALLVPKTEKEEFYKVIANGVFLGDTQRHQWPVIDQTCETEHGD